MSDKRDEEGGSLILFIVLFFLILNQCSVDERLDKLETRQVVAIEGGR